MSPAAKKKVARAPRPVFDQCRRYKGKRGRRENRGTQGTNGGLEIEKGNGDPLEVWPEREKGMKRSGKGRRPISTSHMEKEASRSHLTPWEENSPREKPETPFPGPRNLDDHAKRKKGRWAQKALTFTLGGKGRGSNPAGGGGRPFLTFDRKVQEKRGRGDQ